MLKDFAFAAFKTNLPYNVSLPLVQSARSTTLILVATGSAIMKGLAPKLLASALSFARAPRRSGTGTSCILNL